MWKKWKKWFLRSFWSLFGQFLGQKWAFLGPKNVQKCQKWSKMVKKWKKWDFLCEFIYRFFQKVDFWDFGWFWPILVIFGEFLGPKKWQFIYRFFIFVFFFEKKSKKKWKKWIINGIFMCVFLFFFVKIFEKMWKKSRFLVHFWAHFAIENRFLVFFCDFFWFFLFFLKYFLWKMDYQW